MIDDQAMVSQLNLVKEQLVLAARDAKERGEITPRISSLINKWEENVGHVCEVLGDA